MFIEVLSKYRGERIIRGFEGLAGGSFLNDRFGFVGMFNTERTANRLNGRFLNLIGNSAFIVGHLGLY